jgi:hypothetical protein
MAENFRNSRPPSVSWNENSALFVHERFFREIRRAPIGLTVTIAAASGAILCGGLGIAALFPVPRAMAFVGAAALTGTQILLYSMRDRFRYGRRVALTATAGFAAIVAANISMIAGGLAALQPDQLGQAFISRSLEPTMIATERAVTDLEDLADAVEEVGRYSAEMDAKERGIGGVQYHGTCPGSRLKGDGPAAAYRQYYAETFEGTAEKPGYALVARAEAKKARAKLQAAKSRAARYRLETHDADIAAIATNVAAVIGHIRTANAPAILAALEQHQAEAAKGRTVMVRGRSIRVTCPDTTLDSYIARALQARSTGPDGVEHVGRRVPPQLPPAFSGIERPSEETAVNGLFAEEKRAAIFAVYWLLERAGAPVAPERFPLVDLSPWAQQLLFAPVIDIALVMGLQAIGFRLRRRRTIEDEIAFRLADGDVHPDEVRPAMARAARSEHLCRLRQHLHELEIRPFRGKVMVVPVTEEELIFELEQICRNGGAHDAYICLGAHLHEALLDDRIDLAIGYRVFVLRSNTWDRIECDEIVRQARLMRVEAAQRFTPNLDGEEPRKQAPDGPGDAANDTFAASNTGTEN